MEEKLFKLIPQVGNLYKELEVLSAKARADWPAPPEAIERYKDLLEKTKKIVPENDEFASLRDPTEDITTLGLFMLVSTLDGVLKAAIMD